MKTEQLDTLDLCGGDTCKMHYDSINDAHDHWSLVSKIDSDGLFYIITTTIWDLTLVFVYLYKLTNQQDKSLISNNYVGS